jgi:hypothetical protein
MGGTVRPRMNSDMGPLVLEHLFSYVNVEEKISTCFRK